MPAYLLCCDRGNHDMELRELDIRDRKQWRTWLAAHHTKSPGVWLVFHKEHTGVESMPYEDSIREALCFGWIDSLIKRLDADRYARSSHLDSPPASGPTSIACAGRNSRRRAC